MDKRLKDALEYANYVDAFKNQKRILQQKYEKDLVLYWKGHAFKASVELISFAVNQGSSYWVTDINNIPCFIDEVLEFHKQLQETYNTATTSFGEAYAEMLKGKRSVEGLFSV